MRSLNDDQQAALDRLTAEREANEGTQALGSRLTAHRTAVARRQEIERRTGRRLDSLPGELEQWDLEDALSASLEDPVDNPLNPAVRLADFDPETGEWLDNTIHGRLDPAALDAIAAASRWRPMREQTPADKLVGRFQRLAAGEPE